MSPLWFTFVLLLIAACAICVACTWVCILKARNAERAATVAIAAIHHPPRCQAAADQDAAAARDGYHHCASCGELIHPGPTGYAYGYVHERTRQPMCDPQVTGSSSPTFAEPRMPRAGWLRALDADAIAEPDETATMPPLPRCRTCSQPIEPNPDPSPLSERWRHVGGGPSCWPVDGNTPRDPSLLGNVAEPPRKCVECGRTETAGNPLVGTAALSFDGETVWYCADIRDCIARKLASGRPVHALPDGWQRPELEPAEPREPRLVGDLAAAAFLNRSAIDAEDQDHDELSAWLPDWTTPPAAGGAL